MAGEKSSESSELGMDVICRFSGHLAHELNNLLTPIIACGQMLTDSLNKQDPLYFCAEQIAEAGERCLGLSRKLQIIGSRRAAAQTLDLASLVHEALKTVKIPAQPAIRLDDRSTAGDAAKGDLLVSIDMEQLVYLVGELVGNAITFMPQGGSVRVEVAAADQAGKSGAESATGWVRLTVRDEGIGMDADVQAKMYEPYFSTVGKERDKGLGLTLVYGIVRRAGGVICCESAPGAGTTFDLFFPRKAGFAAG